MEKNIFSYMLIILSLLVSCANGEDMVDVYEQAITEVQSCQTEAEISKLTYRVKEKLLDIANRPGGDNKMSAEETQRILEAQTRYQEAVELQAELITGTRKSSWQ